jgi:phosphoglycolate phosphatase
MIKCCIFDLDGTILDTITTITHFVNSTVERYGVKPITEDECKYFAGNGARLLITRTLESRGVYDKELLEKILREYNAAYDADPLYLTSPFDKIKEMLELLKARGVKLAVLSNKPDLPTRSVVEKFFPGVFDYVAGAKDGVALKPSAEGVMPIFDFFGVTPDECAWIGDTATDILTGKNAGVALKIGVLWGFRDRAELSEAGADLIVTEAKEILDGALRVE